MKAQIAITAAALLFISCSDESSSNGAGAGAVNEYEDVTAASVKEMLSSYTKIFDVSPYYDRGHLPYSVDAGGVEGLTAMASSLDSEGKYLVYCHGDAPSIAGAKALAAAGIKDVDRLQGNFAAWDALAYLDISAAEAKRKIDAGEFAAIYDVSPHYADEHIPGAVDAYNTLSDLIVSKDVMKEYLVYCHADGPSMAGAQLMEDAGFTKVYRLEGNFSAWKADYPVE